MSDNTARGFLDDILANPDDDAPRLIFSDWLEDNGDPERAEFIRVQISRANLPKWDARDIALRIREKQLLEKNGHLWRAGLPELEGVAWTGFRRGFVGEASVELIDHLFSNVEAIWNAAPIESITTLYPPLDADVDTFDVIPNLREWNLLAGPLGSVELQQFRESPVLSTLRVLDLEKAVLSNDGFALLIGSAHLGNVKTLRVGGNFVGNSGLEALLEPNSLDSLTELDLTGTLGSRYFEDPFITADGVRTLTEWSGLERVRTLRLSDQNIGREGLRTLLRSPRAVGLANLDISGNSLNGQALQEFTAAHPDSSLERLDLGRNPFGKLGVAHLARAGCLSELKSLSISRCELPPGAARELASAPFFERLEHLDISCNRLRLQGARSMIEANPRALRSLSLRDTDLDEEGAALLANSSMADTLRELDLSSNLRLGDQVIGTLIKSERFLELLSLNLGRCCIDPQSFDILAQFPLGERLGELITSYDGDVPF